MEDKAVEVAVKWLEGTSKGIPRHCEFEVLALQGLRVIRARKDFFLCSFVVPDLLSDGEGNWHVGAIATLIDEVGAATIYSASGNFRVTLGFSVSYPSTAKIHEEVEIESKVVGPDSKGKLAMVVVEVRKKDNGKPIALAKQWTAAMAMEVKGFHFSKL